MSDKKQVPALEVKRSPDDFLRCQTDKAVTDKRSPAGSRRKVRNSPKTPKAATSTPSTSGSRPKKSRRSLKYLDDEEREEILMDSGSEGEGAISFVNVEIEDELYDVVAERLASRYMRDEVIMEAEDPLSLLPSNTATGAEEDDLEELRLGECEGLNVFSWSEDFSTFSGREETYLHSPGPTMTPQDPLNTFMSVWDDEIMERIVSETNRYAWQYIAPLSETENGIPENFNWYDTSVSEMYRYFAMLILMSLCYRSKLRDYWSTNILEMPRFRDIMSRNRFMAITRFLHFTDNEAYDPTLSPYEKKILKIRPILDHCNAKFASLYIPNKHLSLDESLLLWKGRLGWVQHIRTKAARLGIKSYELCEAVTGYQLRCLLYAGKGSTTIVKSNHGFESCTAKVVLELMDGYLDVGHTLVMDNWYNQLLLTRFLKRRRTDVIGTMNSRRVDVPNVIKMADERRMARGDQIARHCGDISLVAWNDVKLVTTVSTYHSDRQVESKRAGVTFLKPEAIAEYNRYMGGVDLKDQKLSLFLMERKRGKKWYMKVFKRLLNTSLLNTYIIYTKAPRASPLSHRDFRFKVALGLLEQFTKSTPPAAAPVHPIPEMCKDSMRLQIGNHFVEFTPTASGRHKQMRCRRCTMAGRRKMVQLMCSFCQVPLCVGQCWAEYHTLQDLT